MAFIDPYLHFNGNAEEAFRFYKSVFGSDFDKVTRYGEIAGPEFPVTESDAHKIMHIALPVGKSSVLMGSDVLPLMGEVNETGNRFKMAIRAETREEADHLFRGLSAGGSIEVPLADSPGGYFGMFSDRFGIEWMVNFDPGPGGH